MKHDRLHALADGIFAIVMTLLVLDLKIPEQGDVVSTSQLLAAVGHLWPLFFSFVMSFLVLFGYWRAHNVIVSQYTKNLDMNLITINMVFLLFVSLVPFSTNLLGRFIGNRAGIIIYGINLGMLGLTLMAARKYADKADNIETAGNWTLRDRRNGSIRSFFPVVMAMVAAGLSFWSIPLALFVLISSVIINLFTKGLDPLFSMLDALKIGIDE